MKQNLGFAFVYNAMGIPLAAGVPFPFIGWLLSPMVAALGMSHEPQLGVGDLERLAPEASEHRRHRRRQSLVDAAALNGFWRSV